MKYRLFSISQQADYHQVRWCFSSA